MVLSRFDNPTNLGNPSATFQDIIEDTTKVTAETQKLNDLCNQGNREQFIEGLKNYLNVCSSLMDDAKGASRRIEINDVRQKFIDAARSAGDGIVGTLDLVKQLEGNVQNEEEKKMLNDAVADSKEKLTQLSKVKITAMWRKSYSFSLGNDISRFLKKMNRISSTLQRNVVFCTYFL